MTGRKIGIEMASRQRAENAAHERRHVGGAERAAGLAAFLAIGKPSSTVAAEPAPPGTPNRTAGIGSPVAVVEPRPSSSANAE